MLTIETLASETIMAGKSILVNSDGGVNPVFSKSSVVSSEKSAESKVKPGAQLAST